MSTKGFPTSQKSLTGTNSTLNNSGNGFVTAQPAADLRHGLDVIARGGFRVGSASVARTAGATTGNPAGSGVTVIEDTATPAKVGDFVRFEDGNAAFQEYAIVEVATNSFKVAARIPNPPASGDEFFIIRYITPRLAEDGSTLASLSITAAQPVEFAGITMQTITTGAYTQLTASLTDDVSEIEVSNSTGKTLVLALGAAASEVDLMIIPTGGLQRQAVAIANGERVSVRALNANTSVGEVNINYYG